MDISILTENYVIWFYVGILLFIGEIITPGIILLFFGAGAWITSFFLWMFDINITLQFIIFVSTSIILLLILRKFLTHKFFSAKVTTKSDLADDFIGRTALAAIDFEPGQIGKVTLNGTQWNATSSVSIKKDQFVDVIDFENITLIVKPKN